MQAMRRERKRNAAVSKADRTQTETAELCWQLKAVADCSLTADRSPSDLHSTATSTVHSQTQLCQAGTSTAQHPEPTSVSDDLDKKGCACSKKEEPLVGWRPERRWCLYKPSTHTQLHQIQAFPLPVPNPVWVVNKQDTEEGKGK